MAERLGCHNPAPDGAARGTRARPAACGCGWSTVLAVRQIDHEGCDAHMAGRSPRRPHPDLPADWSAREAGQAAAFDRISDRYGEAFPHKEGQLACGKWRLARLQLGARALDVGSGTGLPWARLRAAGGGEVPAAGISPA